MTTTSHQDLSDTSHQDFVTVFFMSWQIGCSNTKQQHSGSAVFIERGYLSRSAGKSCATQVPRGCHAVHMHHLHLQQTHMHICARVCTDACLCQDIYAYVCTRIHMCACEHAHVLTCIHVCTHVCIHTCMYTCVHA